MGENNEISHNIKFNVRNLVEAPPAIIDAAEKAISMVWEKNVGDPTETTLTFAERIVDPSGQDTGRSAAYNPNPHRFQFALDTMRERIKFGTDDVVTMIFIAAHEAKHMVQITKGGHPRTLLSNEPIDEQYNDDPYEKDAWMEALHVIKKLFPGATGAIEVQGRFFEVPIESKY
jgi:hypothetical protein